MHVVRHQRIGQERTLEALSSIVDESKIDAVIPLAEENCLAIIAPANQMIDIAGSIVK